MSHNVDGNRPTTVRIGDGRVVPVKGYGTMHIESTCLGCTRTISFHDVLYVPDVHVNLLSLSRIDAMGAECKFHNNKCSTVTVNNVAVLQASLSDKTPFCGLRVLHGVSAHAHGLAHGDASLVASAPKATNDCNWHKCMGHLGLTSL